MASRYFLISEIGDDGAWLIDTQTKSVEHLASDMLEAGADVPESDFVANLKELRGDRNLTIFQGVNLAIAAKSLAGPSGHTRREGGD